jgi:hypothetical protein
MQYQNHVQSLNVMIVKRHENIGIIDNFVQCPSRVVLYFGRLTFADCTVTKNRLKNSNIFMTFNDHDV